MNLQLLSDDIELASLEMTYFNALAEFESADEFFERVKKLRAERWRELAKATTRRSEAVNRKRARMIERLA